MSPCRPWRAVALLACGHAVSMALVAAATALRWPLERSALQWGAGLLLMAALVCQFRIGHAIAGQLGMMLCSFIVSTAHGAGFLLMPALMTICGAGNTGPLMQMLAVLTLHLAAMVAASGALA